MKPRSTRSCAALTLLAVLGGCGSSPEASDDFHTSGSKEADQRAEQRISKIEQIHGEADGSSSVKPTLFERLGGQKGLEAIVADFVERVVQDPRVNWERKGIKRGGVLGVGGRSAEWQPTQDNLQRLRQHLTQMLALATGGPARYEGRDMKEVHSGMRISNVELDAAVGDMKATLDKLRVPNQEQKELLAILESTRPQVAEER